MSTATSAVPSRPFAAHAGDPHTRAARALASRLAAVFPRAGIGVTGSVAAGTHGADSDLDMVVVDAAFQHDAQCATRVNGIRASIVCLRLDGGPARAQGWALAAGGDARIVAMIRSVHAVHDPDAALEGLQRVVAACDAERVASRAGLLTVLRERAAALVRALDQTPLRAALLARLLNVILDGWCLKQGLTIDSKETDRRLFETIADADPALGELLCLALPLTSGSRPALLGAFDLVFGPEGAPTGTTQHR
jgi:hypothetical protein